MLQKEQVSRLTGKHKIIACHVIGKTYGTASRAGLGTTGNGGVALGAGAVSVDGLHVCYLSCLSCLRRGCLFL